MCVWTVHITLKGCTKAFSNANTDAPCCYANAAVECTRTSATAKASTRGQSDRMRVRAALSGPMRDVSTPLTATRQSPSCTPKPSAALPCSTLSMIAVVCSQCACATQC
eukprot:14843-Heterococcus_DN1.PRE.3